MVNVLGTVTRQLSELLPRVNDALQGRGLNRMYVKPEQVSPVLHLLRGQDSFEHQYAKARSTPNATPSRTSRSKGPVDLGFDVQRPPAVATGSRDGFEPASRPLVQMRPAELLRPMTAREASARFMAQLGASVVG